MCSYSFSMKIKNSFSYKVYFKDTDAGGVVYYANYLKFLEMARTDFLDQCGISSKFFYDKKIFFAVKKVEANYIKPIFYGDIIQCKIKVEEIKNASFKLKYEIFNKDNLTFIGSTIIVSVTENFQVIKLPEQVKNFLLSSKNYGKI